jgi:subtilisin family serine protease
MRYVGLARVGLLLCVLLSIGSGRPPRDSGSTLKPGDALDAELRTVIALGPDRLGVIWPFVSIYPHLDGAMVGVLVDGQGAARGLRSASATHVSRAPDGAVSARVLVRRLSQLARAPGIGRIQGAARRRITTSRAVPLAFGQAEPFDALGLDRSVVGTGEHTLVAVLDTGVDASHPALRNADGSTRVAAYLDLESGEEWAADDIDINPDVLPADVSGHGTHVAGIIAGNASSASGATPYVGMAPDAQLLVVRVADSSGSVSDDALIAGLEWAAAKRGEIEAARGVPTRLVANLSFGGLLGPNDGTSVCDLAISSFADAGMVVVPSAGNEHGQGVHTQGQLAAGASRDIAFASTIWARSSRMVASLWYEADSEMSVEVIEDVALGLAERAVVFAGGQTSFGIGDAGSVRSGASTLTIAHTDEGVSGRHVLVSMDGTFDPGSLRLRLSAPGDVGGGTWHAWIDTAGAQVAWANPVESATVNSPATAEAALAVASFVSRAGGPSPTVGDISVFSSSGPIRNQDPFTPKPDIAAGGEVLIATRSRFSPLDAIAMDYEGRAGTSQATPIVAGAAALIVSKFPHLSADAVRRAIIDTADSAAGDDPDRWGAGRVNVVAAMAQLALDSDPPALVSSQPEDGATALDPADLLTTGVVLVFSEPVGGGASLRLDGVELATSVLIEDARLALSIEDADAMQVGREYVVRIEVTDAAGNPFITEVTFDTFPPRDPVDVNGDGVINIIDIVIVATAFGGDAALTPTADVNGDGVINIVDLISVAVRFASPAAPARDGYAALATTRDALRVELDSGRPDVARALDLLNSLLAARDAAATLLLSPYPNPFNPDTWIPFSLGAASDVQLSIYDAGGMLVRRLDIGTRAAGMYVQPGRAVHWDGRDGAGGPVASGWYAVELVAGSQRRTTRVLLAK